MTRGDLVPAIGWHLGIVAPVGCPAPAAPQPPRLGLVDIPLFHADARGRPCGNPRGHGAADHLYRKGERPATGRPGPATPGALRGLGPGPTLRLSRAPGLC